MKEANKEAAAQCLEVAERALAAGDLEKADRFVQKAQRLFPTDAVRAGAAMGRCGAGSGSRRPPAACCRPRLHGDREAAPSLAPDRLRGLPPQLTARRCRLLRLQARLLQQRIKRAAEAGSSGAANGRPHGAGPAGMGSGPNLRQRHAPAAPSGGASSSRRHEPPPDEDHKARAGCRMLPLLLFLSLYRGG